MADASWIEDADAIATKVALEAGDYKRAAAIWAALKDYQDTLERVKHAVTRPDVSREAREALKDALERVAECSSLDR